jgi:hypothetical protein
MTLCLLGCSAWSSAQQPSILDQQGKQLRADIEKAYRELDSQKKLTGAPEGTDITEVIQKYLTPGMSFDVAVMLLRSAGFKVDLELHPGLHPEVNHPGKDSVIASINPLDYGFPWSVAVVTLEPIKPGDYTTIRHASGTIYLTMP